VPNIVRNGVAGFDIVATDFEQYTQENAGRIAPVLSPSQKPFKEPSYLPIGDLAKFTEEELLNHQHNADGSNFTREAASYNRRNTYNQFVARAAAFKSAGLVGVQGMSGYLDFNRRKRKEILDSEIAYLYDHQDDPNFTQATVDAMSAESHRLGGKISSGYNMKPNQPTMLKKVGTKTTIKIAGVDTDRLDDKDVTLIRREELKDPRNAQILQIAKENEMRQSLNKKRQEAYEAKMRVYLKEKDA
jgi:hypothetical protein